MIKYTELIMDINLKKQELKELELIKTDMERTMFDKIEIGEKKKVGNFYFEKKTSIIFDPAKAKEYAEANPDQAELVGKLEFKPLATIAKKNGFDFTKEEIKEVITAIDANADK